MPPFLKAKTAGLPRWAWLTIGVGAIGIGLYLRHKSSESEEEETPVAETPEGLAGYGETDTAGGLAAAGLIGPASATQIPVQTPFLPEGLTDVITGLGEIITAQGTVIESITNERTAVGAETPVITGGGAPQEGGAHTPAPTPKVCPTGTVSKLRNNKNEIQRLQGEINNLQGEIGNLTNLIQSHPKANNVNQWKQQRAQDQANIQGKRAKVAALSAEQAALRRIPGCGSVAV